MSGLLSPVLDPKVPKPVVVRQVKCDQDEVVRSGYGGDLPVRERRDPARQSQTRAFGGVPPGRAFVVRQDLDRRGDHVVEVFFDCRPPLGSRQPVAAKEQLVPDDRSGGEVLLMSSEPLEDFRVRRRTQRLGQNVGVKQIPAHKRGSRPGEGSRTPLKSSGSMSSRGRSTASRNAPYASQNLSLPAARRRYSRSESMTATGSPRRVSSMRSLPSNSCTIAARSCLASAMVYRLDMTYSLHGHLDSHFNRVRSPVNDRGDCWSRLDSGEDFVSVVRETMQPEYVCCAWSRPATSGEWSRGREGLCVRAYDQDHGGARG